jgi:hypothetical protein
MLNLATWLYSVLSNNAAIAYIVGTCIFPDVQPKAPTEPSLTYRILGTTQSATFATRGMQRARIEIYCESPTVGEAAGLLDAVDEALNGYQGTFDGTYIQNCDRIQALGPHFDHELLLYRCTIEFYVQYA